MDCGSETAGLTANVQSRRSVLERAAVSSHELARELLPISIHEGRETTSVVWLRTSAGTADEPFFDQSVMRLLGGKPAPRRWVSPLSWLIDGNRQVPTTQPAGFVFHISRCGSTLVCHALRAGGSAVVIAEADPITGLAGA